MDKTSIGDRMKQYEAVPKLFLMRKNPVIIRLDGKAFHSFTKGFDKPFDEHFMSCMKATMMELCKEVQGCVLGYTQSDEITLVLCDYQKIDTDAWFGYNLQKIVSISASIATLTFHRHLEFLYDYTAWGDGNSKEALLREKLKKDALFDSRAFSLPLHEVANCLIWRQQDATRNSIQSLAQSLYPHKELQGLNTKQLQDKMFTEKGVNWNDLPTEQKRGSCCIKTEMGWQIDYEIPIFTQNRNYVESRLIFEDSK